MGSTTLHHLVATASPHDAVTGQALAWQRALAGHGVRGEIFAEQVDRTLKGRVLPLRRFDPTRGESTLLHYSIWSDVVTRALESPAGRLAVYYQNVTPGHYFEAVNPVVAALCDQGRRGLCAFAGHVASAIAPSEYNAAELRAAGIHEVTVVPLLLDVGAPPPARTSVDPVILTVGRVVPNKRLEEAIRVLALLRRHAITNATLVVVGGSDGFELYNEALRRFAATLGVTGAVTFTGVVSDHRLDELYTAAGAYLCMSEHEGFCAPLIEAMSHGLPVVARGAAAVPETLGGAGIVVPDGDPAATMEALDSVLTNSPLREELARRAAVRLAELAPERVERLIRAAVAPLID